MTDRPNRTERIITAGSPRFVQWQRLTTLCDVSEHWALCICMSHIGNVQSKVLQWWHSVTDRALYLHDWCHYNTRIHTHNSQTVLIFCRQSVKDTIFSGGLWSHTARQVAATPDRRSFCYSLYIYYGCIIYYARLTVCPVVSAVLGVPALSVKADSSTNTSYYRITL